MTYFDNHVKCIQNIKIKYKSYTTTRHNQTVCPIFFQNLASIRRLFFHDPELKQKTKGSKTWCVRPFDLLLLLSLLLLLLMM